MMISTGGKWHGIPNERGLIQGLAGGGRVGLGTLITYPTHYPGSLDRLYPSIAPATADPGAVMSSKNGLAGTGSLGYIASWPQIPTEYGLIAAALADQEAANAEAGHDTRPTIDASTEQTLSATPLVGLGDLTPSNPAYDRAVQATVDRIDRMIPNDAAYGPAGVRLYAGIMAYRLGRTAARDSRILSALDRLNTRYEYVLKHYPGTTVISSSSPLPRPVGPVQPIVQAYPDGSFAYAPGYGPASQYGAYQVAGRGVPSSPRVSAYTGRVVQGGSLSGLGDTITPTGQVSSFDPAVQLSSQLYSDEYLAALGLTRAPGQTFPNYNLWPGYGFPSANGSDNVDTGETLTDIQNRLASQYRLPAVGGGSSHYWSSKNIVAIPIQDMLKLDPLLTLDQAQTLKDRVAASPYAPNDAPPGSTPLSTPQGWVWQTPGGATWLGTPPSGTDINIYAGAGGSGAVIPGVTVPTTTIPATTTGSGSSGGGGSSNVDSGGNTIAGLSGTTLAIAGGGLVLLALLMRR